MMNTKKDSLSNKFFQALIFVFGSIWFGSQISKLLTIFHFFQSDEFGRLSLRESINFNLIVDLYYQLIPLFSVTIVSYIIFIIILFIYFLNNIRTLKFKGWLFISIVIIFFCVPFEIYLLSIDWKILVSAYNKSANPYSFIKLSEERISILGNFPLISIFLHLITLFLISFKPLDKENRVEN